MGSRNLFRGAGALLLSLSFATSGLASPAGPIYSMDDFVALDRQQAWEELSQHLLDIAPSQRDSRWQAILERTALGLLQQHAAEPVVAQPIADSLTHRFPTLRQAPAFMRARADVGLSALRVCVQKSGECSARFLDYIDGDPDNVDLAFEAGKALAATEPAGSVSFFRRGLRTRKGSKGCGEGKVARAVVAALDLPAEDPRVVEAIELGDKTCWDQLKGPIVDAFGNGSPRYKANACRFLATKSNVLSQGSLSQCQQQKGGGP